MSQYYYAPGHQYIKVVVPRPKRPGADRMPSIRAMPQKPVSPLVRDALEAAFGNRSPESLTHALFAMGVRNHIRARRRTTPERGKVQLLSCHVREGGEWFGTVAVSGKRYGWAARIEDGRLTSFKVL